MAKITQQQYLPRLPVTHVEIMDSNMEHCRVKIWIDHGLAGELVVPMKDVLSFMVLLVNDSTYDPNRKYACDCGNTPCTCPF